MLLTGVVLARVTAGRLVAWAVPAIVLKLAVGFLLGNTLLPFEAIRPLSGITELGVLTLIFQVGLEVRGDLLSSRRNAVLRTVALSFLAPLPAIALLTVAMASAGVPMGGYCQPQSLGAVGADGEDVCGAIGNPAAASVALWQQASFQGGLPPARGLHLKLDDAVSWKLSSQALMNSLSGTAPLHLEQLGLCALPMLLMLPVAWLGEHLDPTDARP